MLKALVLFSSVIINNVGGASSTDDAVDCAHITVYGHNRVVKDEYVRCTLEYQGTVYRWEVR